MSISRLVLDSAWSAASIVGKLDLKQGPLSIEKVGTFIQGATMSGEGLKMYVNLGAVQAFDTFTFTGQPTAADTCTINGVTFTARASGAVANEFNIGSSVALTCANMAAAINASTSAKIANTVFAKATATTVVVTCLTPGTIGNLCTMTESLGNCTITGANFAGGTEGTNYILQHGR